jgi:aminoglycoside 6'-N-acetyltransferase
MVDHGTPLRREWRKVELILLPVTGSVLQVDASRFDFRPLARTDYALLRHWLRTPHVARWWADDSSEEGLEEMYGGCIDGTEPSQVFIAERSGRAIGLAQRFRIHSYAAYREEIAVLTDIPTGTSSIDYLIGPAEAIGRGWGTELIRAFTARVWQDDADAVSIIVPVHAENIPSWRVLESAGFRRVAAGQLTPDNPVDTTDHFIYRLDRPRGT